MLLPDTPKFYIETFPDMTNKFLNFAQLGYDKCAPLATFSHYRDFYIIHYINKGSGTIKINGKIKELKTNDTFIVKPNQLLIQTADNNDPWELVFFAIGGPMADFLISRTVFAYNNYFSFKDKAFSEEISKSINNVLNFNTNTLTNFNHLFNLLAFFESSSTPKKPKDVIRKNSGEDIVDSVKTYIKSNYSKPIKVSDISKQLNLNRSHLFRIFKQRTNMSIEEYLTMTRINQACHLLKTTNFTVSTISSLVGFQYYPNFSKHFKENIGTTPTKYRNI